MTPHRTPGQREKGQRKNEVLLLFAAFLCAFPCPYVQASDTAGTSGAVFLKIAPGARPAGMGEAFTGVADDVHAVYWNPAGLARLNTPEITGMHMQYFQSIQYEFAAFAVPAAFGTVSVAVTNLHTDGIDRRTEDTDTPTGSFGASDSAYWLGYGWSWSERLSLGANVKYVRETLDSTLAQAYAFDGGALYDTGWHDVRLGASVQNLGSKVKFNDEADPLPFTVRAGASVPFLEKKLLIASDVLVPRDHAPGVALGGEYRRPVSRDLSVAMRSGYRTDQDVDGLKGVSAGGGVTVGRASLDFAWVPFGDLGNSYRLSLHVKLGEPDTAPRLQHASTKTVPDPFLEGLLALH